MLLLCSLLLMPINMLFQRLGVRGLPHTLIQIHGHLLIKALLPVLPLLFMTLAYIHQQTHFEQTFINVLDLCCQFLIQVVVATSHLTTFCFDGSVVQRSLDGFTDHFVHRTFDSGGFCGLGALLFRRVDSPFLSSLGSLSNSLGLFLLTLCFLIR